MGRRSPAYHLAALAVLGAACTPVLAEELTSEDILSGACLTAGQPREEGPIKELTFQITRQHDPAGYSGDLLRLSFTEWDVPNIVFETIAACWSDGPGIQCSIDCDGGRAYIAGGDGEPWTIRTEHLAYSMTGPESLFALQAEQGVDLGQLTGTFAIRRNPDNRMCRATADYVFAALEPGDISPRVLQAERLLSRWGQFLEFPDSIYDEATADAVTRFQRQYGLAETGIIDEATMSALVAAGAAGQSC